MNSANKWVWLSDNHRRRYDLFATQSGKLPNPREGEWLEVFAAKPIRLFAVASLLPLVKASCGYEASTFSECLSEQGQLVNSLSTGVDVRDFGLFLHPKWNEAPSGHRQFALTVSWIDANNGD